MGGPYRSFSGGTHCEGYPTAWPRRQHRPTPPAWEMQNVKPTAGAAKSGSAARGSTRGDKALAVGLPRTARPMKMVPRTGICGERMQPQQQTSTTPWSFLQSQRQVPAASAAREEACETPSNLVFLRDPAQRCQNAPVPKEGGTGAIPLKLLQACSRPNPRAPRVVEGSQNHRHPPPPGGPPGRTWAFCLTS
jgi:hypothetical protein